jgi:hypothetical protein
MYPLLNVQQHSLSTPTADWIGSSSSNNTAEQQADTAISLSPQHTSLHKRGALGSLMVPAGHLSVPSATFTHTLSVSVVQI